MTNTSSKAPVYDGKISIPFLKVMAMFLDHQSESFTGSQVMKNTKLKSGTVYPLLSRLANGGWLSANWEDMDPLKDRQPRRLYKLTDSGKDKALEVLSEELSPTVANSFNKLKPTK